MKVKVGDNVKVIAGKDKGKTEGRAEGLAEGEAKGKIEEKYSIAKSMLKEKLDMDIISKVTGLSKKEIEKISL